MIKAAGDLIEDGYVEKACQQWLCLLFSAIIFKKSILSKLLISPTNESFLKPKNCYDIVG